MNTPGPEFVRGVSPGLTSSTPVTWQERIGPAVVLFEANRNFEPEKNLERELQVWRLRNRLPRTAGFSCRVEFPDANKVDQLIWTAHRAFYARKPNDQDPPPTRVLYFVSRQGLLEWVREMIPVESRQRYLVIPRLYGPDWSVTPGLLLVLFGKNCG